MKGVLPWLVRWAGAGTRDFCAALDVLVGPVQNTVFFSLPNAQNDLKNEKCLL
jgi:hypothetical protein